jgi:DNA-binding HxlR family transcriptional regulator
MTLYSAFYWKVESHYGPIPQVWLSIADKYNLNEDVVRCYLSDVLVSERYCPWFSMEDKETYFLQFYPSAVVVGNDKVNFSTGGLAIYYSYIVWCVSLGRDPEGVSPQEVDRVLRNIDQLYDGRPYNRDMLHVWKTIDLAQVDEPVPSIWQSMLSSKIGTHVVPEDKINEEEYVLAVTDAIVELEGSRIEPIKFDPDSVKTVTSDGHVRRCVKEPAGTWCVGDPPYGTRCRIYYLPYTQKVLYYCDNSRPPLDEEDVRDMNERFKRNIVGYECNDMACVYADSYFAATRKGEGIRSKLKTIHKHNPSKLYFQCQVSAGYRKIRQAYREIMDCSVVTRITNVHNVKKLDEILVRAGNKRSENHGSVMFAYTKKRLIIPKAVADAKMVTDYEVPVSLDSICSRSGLTRDFVYFVIKEIDAFEMRGPNFMVWRYDPLELNDANILRKITSRPGTYKEISARMRMINRSSMVKAHLVSMVDRGLLEHIRYEGRTRYILPKEKLAKEDVRSFDVRDSRTLHQRVISLVNLSKTINVSAMVRILKANPYAITRELRAMERKGWVRKRPKSDVWESISVRRT